MAQLIHSDCIKTKMTELANITTQAQARITPQILSNSAREMQENLGADGYDTYVSDFSAYDAATYPVFDVKEFGILSDTEKAMRNLIFAEAYFGLYYLAIALKKLVKGSVNVSAESSGSSKINVSPYDEIIANADNYRESALNCLSFVSTISAGDDSEVYSDGSIGIFVI